MHIEMTRQILYTRGGLLDELMDKGFAASCIVDAMGRVIRYSLPTLRDLGKTQAECQGRPVEEIDPATHLGRVALSGVAETGRLMLMHGKYHIVNEMPIFDRDERIGAIGMLFSFDTNRLKRALARQPKGEVEGGLYDTVARASGSYTFNDYIGEHPLVRTLLEQCRRAATANCPILLAGETGTGKEILSGAIHSAAFPEGTAPYVKLNCTAIPDNLLESELFGHEKGAFTGAVASKQGKFELAGGGSLLLDEIGEMDLRLQSKLLRVLEEKEFERLGGVKMQVMNTRVIAATNANLPQLCDEKRFRPDLYYRLSTVEIFIPPLRARASDIPMLVSHFVEREGLAVRFDDGALEALMAYGWPGNVRQLRNIVMRMGLAANGETVGGDDIRKALVGGQVPSFFVPPATTQPATPQRGGTMMGVEREAIFAALAANDYNQSQTARQLGIGRTTLYRKMKQYGVGGGRFQNET